jgi:hypothetical protein
MASERQIAANRRNAQKSTGPRTKSGKARASGNAYRHGLRSRPLISESRTREIEELARKIAAQSTSPIVLEWARTAAEAELDLARMRRIRAILIEQATRPSKRSQRLPLSSVTETRLLHRWRKSSSVPPADANSAASLPLTEPDRTVAGMRQLLPQLQIIARYEQRAWSRREKNLRSITQALSLKPDVVNLEASPTREPPPI